MLNRYCAYNKKILDNILLFSYQHFAGTNVIVSKSLFSAWTHFESHRLHVLQYIAI